MEDEQSTCTFIREFRLMPTANNHGLPDDAENETVTFDSDCSW
jgi:hypothetical protein